MNTVSPKTRSINRTVLIVEVLDVLEGRIEPMIPKLKFELSYYSEPTAQDWLALKNRRFKLA